ncbi:MetS family NSS transporter small subunit [Salidesulfovibrio onnuriiensis]|nr:MetS family NSS transporter small subunit [Salidesulfovibrio onnuriiensis]
MSIPAITMMAVGCTLVWGGLLVCLRIALVKETERINQPE